VINPFWHLESIQELKNVKNKYDHILWGEPKGGYYEEIDTNCKCKMQIEVDCCPLRTLCMDISWTSVGSFWVF
jgi:hypothetical protein